MHWRFRKSFKPIPGLKLNLSKTGMSLSIGGAPFTMNLGSRGSVATGSIPGTGISFRHRLAGGMREQGSVRPYKPPPSSTAVAFPGAPEPPPSRRSFLPTTYPGSDPQNEVCSAHVELLTSANLAELKRLIQLVQAERLTIAQELSSARQEEAMAAERLEEWERRLLGKWIRRTEFAGIRSEAEIATAKVRELEDQLRLTTIAAQLDLGNEQAGPFLRMREAFKAMAECAAIWDVRAQRSTNAVQERTSAAKSINRERVRFLFGGSDLIQWTDEVPYLLNANGGDIFLYPGFILYQTSPASFAVIDYHDVNLKSGAVQMAELEVVPSDSKVVGNAWSKVNKDGNPDRRFHSNYRVPLVRYGELTFWNASGLHESYLLSNPESTERFVKAWGDFVGSFEHRVSLDLPPTEAAAAEPDPQTSTKPQRLGADIHFECNACRQPIEVSAEAGGQEFRCPSCGGKLVVPEISN